MPGRTAACQHDSPCGSDSSVTPAKDETGEAQRTSRVVLVTGGSRGIGLGCARRFRALGDRVAVTYRSAPPADGDAKDLLAVR